MSDPHTFQSSLSASPLKATVREREHMEFSKHTHNKTDTLPYNTADAVHGVIWGKGIPKAAALVDLPEALSYGNGSGK